MVAPRQETWAWGLACRGARTRLLAGISSVSLATRPALAMGLCSTMGKVALTRVGERSSLGIFSVTTRAMGFMPWANRALWSPVMCTRITAQGTCKLFLRARELCGVG